MNHWAHSLNFIAERWEISMVRASWQGGLALILVWVISRRFNRLPAAAKVWLWRLAFAKCLIAFFWSTPIDLPLLPANLEVQGSRFEVQGSRLERITVAEFARGDDITVGGVTAPQNAAVEANARATLRPTTAAWLLMGWSIGLMACGTALGWQFLRARALRRSSHPVEDPILTREAEQMAAALGLERTPGMAISQSISAPLLLGVIRPLILLPETTVVATNPANLRMILAHEMAHVKRRDLLWLWFCTMEERFFFFHPVFWCVGTEWRMAQEMACDQWAIRATNSAASQYAAMLLEVVNGHRKPALALSMGASKRRLERRIIAMKNITSMSRARVLVLGMGLAAMAALGIIPWRVVAQSRPPVRAADLAKPTSPSAASAAIDLSGRGEFSTINLPLDDLSKLQISQPEQPELLFIADNLRTVEPEETQDEIAKLRAENERLKLELKKAQRDSIATQQEIAAATKQKLKGDLDERLGTVSKRLGELREELTTQLQRLTEQHPLVTQKRAQIEMLAKQQAELSKSLLENLPVAGRLFRRPSEEQLQQELDDLLTKYAEDHPLVKERREQLENLRLSQPAIAELRRTRVGKKKVEAEADDTKRTQQRELLLEEVKLAEEQLGYTQKKFEEGLNIRDEWLRSARELYAAKQELARVDGDKAELKKMADEQMKLIDEQIVRVLGMIKAGKLPPGADLELRKELIRIRRQALNLQ